MKKYSMIFIFNKDLTKVLLIHKIRPEWQKGKLNGLGGKIEESETPQECIIREVNEESTLILTREDVQYYGEMINNDSSTTQLFTTIYQNAENDAKTVEDQQIEWIEVNSLPGNIMSNLSWLIPLAKDFLVNKEIKKVSIENH